MRLLIVLAASILPAIALPAQATTATSTRGSLAGRPVRVTSLPTRLLPPRLTGRLVRLTGDSLTFQADSVQILTSPNDPEVTARIPCGACVEVRLALVDLEKVEIATLPPANAWKQTRRRGAIAGAIVGGSLFAGIQVARGNRSVLGASVPGALLGAWLGGTIGAAWPRHPTWNTIYSNNGTLK